MLIYDKMTFYDKKEVQNQSKFRMLFLSTQLLQLSRHVINKGITI
jgi:hypothetical protein